MKLHADDAGLVRAPAALVHRRLADIGSWPTWWPGTRIRGNPATDGSVWLVELHAGPGRRLRYGLRPHTIRPGRGFHLEVRGDAVGDAEFWLETTRHGTVVHHLLDVDTGLARPARLLADHRRAVRRGLWGLKDALQLEVRTSAGMTP
jgi:hypothetical protein